tara:strand:+ start:238 stop:723 length:486 start_codon:yes stop_codon:yes gene_type:complete
MRRSIIFILFVLIGCQAKTNNNASSNNQVNNDINTEVINIANNISCDKDVCLQLINHDSSKKTFDIYMTNSNSVAGFQCDFSGIKIVGSEGGLLKENGYQTSHSDNRILSFSMHAKLIQPGKGVLSTIVYSESVDQICMTGIIFAGSGGEQLTNSMPECIK